MGAAEFYRAGPFQALTFSLPTSSRSSLLGLKKVILFGGTSTWAPVFGLRPNLVAGSQGTDDAVKYGANDDVGIPPGHLNGLIQLLGQIGPSLDFHGK